MEMAGLEPASKANLNSSHSQV